MTHNLTLTTEEAIELLRALERADRYTPYTPEQRERVLLLIARLNAFELNDKLAATEVRTLGDIV